MTIVASGTRAEQVLKNKAFMTMDDEKSNKLFYGVELELEAVLKKENIKELGLNYNPNIDYSWQHILQTHLSNMCDKEFDGCAITKSEGLEYGFEIVTVPATLKAHREVIWHNFFENIGPYLKASDRTGMHIHFSRNAISNKALAKIIYFIHDTRNSCFLSKIAGRKVYAGASWCTQRAKEYNMTEAGVTHILNSEGSGSPRGALTVSSRNSGKTVECRIFTAVNTRQGVMQAIDFIDALLAYCEEVGDNAKDLTPDAFIKWFDQGLKKDLWPWLHTNLTVLNYIKGLPITIDSIKKLVRSMVTAA